MKDREMKPDLLINYNTTTYYHYVKGDGSRKRKETQELYFTSTKNGKNGTNMLEINKIMVRKWNCLKNHAD